MGEDKYPEPFNPDAIKVPSDEESYRSSHDIPEGESPGPEHGEYSADPNQPASDGLEQGSYGNLSLLGSDLASVMQDEGYHPVVLFGTNNSGKTSILMSLFSTLTSEPSLDTGLILSDPLLGSRNDTGRQLHKEAQHTFDIKTQAFLDGEKIPKTSTRLPFFIPVEFRPPNGRLPVKFAFLESNGEWYRPLISDGGKLGEADRLYPGLRSEIESFIASFQNGITFIYTAPFTQGEAYAASENRFDARELRYASLAIKGVLENYDRIRANGRADDKHLMLVTKWDAQSKRSTDRAEGIEEDASKVAAFCHDRYGQALAAFQGLLQQDQRRLNAYCAGMINEHGLLTLQPGDPVRGVIASYPVRLWTYLYRNARMAAGDIPSDPWPRPGKSIFQYILDLISG